MAHRILGYLLPPELDEQLRAHCEAYGDDPADVLADALELHFDALAGDVETARPRPSNSSCRSGRSRHDRRWPSLPSPSLRAGTADDRTARAPPRALLLPTPGRGQFVTVLDMTAPVPGLVTAALAWPFPGLQPQSYDLIMADPAWPTRMRSRRGERKSPGHHYRLMTWAEIFALPIGLLAAPHCLLFLWVPWPLVLYGGDPARHYADHDASQSRVGEAIRSWGFRYVTGGAWHKRGRRGGTVFGTGYRVRSACEPWFLCIRGQPKTSRSERNLIEGLRREHSRKPEDAYAWCERYMPGARRCELFSRTSRPGWDTWGDEAGKFDQAPEAAP